MEIAFSNGGWAVPTVVRVTSLHGHYPTSSGLRSAYGPVGWSVTSGPDGPAPGAWTKVLPTVPGGDAFSLVRLSAGASVDLSGSNDDRFLLLSGELDLARVDAPSVSTERHAGDYFPVAGGRSGTVTSRSGAMLLRLSGPRLGAPATDVFGPGGWQPAGPGQWFRPLLDVAFDETFDERLVGLAYMEPGSTSARHPHRTAHRFLFLEGDADDELLFPNGRRETARRRHGDFVDYPYPVEHQTSSPSGCLLLFVHEPLDTEPA